MRPRRTLAEQGLRPPRRIHLGLIALVPFALLAACADPGVSSDPVEPPPVPVEVFTVAPTRMARTLMAVGTVDSPQTTAITADLAGKVTFLDIPEGQRVEKGHLLARIDDDQARAAVHVNRARARNAAEIFARLKTLRGEDVTSQQELDDARAELQANEGELDDAETVLRKMAIRAPFTGVLGLREVSLGAHVEPGAPLVRLSQTDPLHLVFSLPERHAGQVAVGQQVRGVVASCERFTARISVIDPHVDPASRLFRLQAVVPNPDALLLPGMSATLRVEMASIDGALAIPTEAVVRQGTKRLVYTVEAEGTVREREIVLGQTLADRVQVEAGLGAGDVVVASGHQKLRPGSKVAPQPYTPVDNPNLRLGADGAAAGCDF